MTLEPSAFVQQYAPWSVSKADTARNCPRKFKYQYIDKLKGFRSPRFEDAFVGKAVHKLLEYTLSVSAPASRFVDVVIKEYSLEGESLERFNAMLPSVDTLLVKLLARQTKWNCGAPKIEQKMAVSLEGKAVDFFDNAKAFFRGVVDLSYYIEQKKHSVIFDHKTGKDRGTKYYTNQFNGYIWLAKACNPELEGVQVAVNFLQTNRTEFSPFQFVHDAGEFRDRVVGFLNKSTAKVEDLEATKPGPLCPWCDFHSICPAKQVDNSHGKEISGEDRKGTDA